MLFTSATCRTWMTAAARFVVSGVVLGQNVDLVVDKEARAVHCHAQEEDMSGIITYQVVLLV